MFRTLFRRARVVVRDSWSYSDAEIQAVADRCPWMLQCAIMAHNGSDGMVFGFDTWWRLSGDNWLNPMKSSLPLLTNARLKTFLLDYVKQNAAGGWRAAGEAAALRAGIAPLVTLGPGESMTVKVVVTADAVDPDGGTISE